jgi:membrane protease YdiL (CAAX protease family)
MSEAPTGKDAARDLGAKEALLAAGGLLLLLGVGKSFAGFIPYGADAVFTAAAAYQLYVPLWLIQNHGELPESHAIHIHGLLLGTIAGLRRRRVAWRRRRRRRRQSRLDRTLAYYGRGAVFRPRALGADLGRALLIAVVTFVPFAVGHHFWQMFNAPPGKYVYYRSTIPPDLFAIWLKNTFLVALPEELFYRGFVETRLERIWPTKRFVLGVPIGRTVIVASAMFALGHYLGEWGNPARLGPFFPAFIFSMLTRRGGSITGAVAYHGLSNAFSATLLAGYVIKSGPG